MANVAAPLGGTTLSPAKTGGVGIILDCGVTLGLPKMMSRLIG